jgi:hypothetical protein
MGKSTAGISPVLYHYTKIWAAKDILKDNRFRLGTSAGTESDDVHGGGGRFYFLSTTRHKLGGYHLDPYSGVLFVLDGTRLGQRYKGAPVDYWGEEFRKISPGKAEAEDRIWSKEPYMEPADDYIKEVHVLDQNIAGARPAVQRQFRDLLKYAKKLKIPHYIYTDKNAFQILDKRKAVSLKELGLEPSSEPERYWGPKRKQLKEWLELYHGRDEKKLGKRARHILDSYLKYDYGSFRDKELLDVFSADIHNNKSSEEVRSIIEIMQKRGWKKLGDFLDYLKEKWREKRAEGRLRPHLVEVLRRVAG